jgi:hypothetical protein
VVHPRKLLARHSFSNSETLDLLGDVIVGNSEREMLCQLSLSRNLVELCANSTLNYWGAEWYVT